MKLEIIETTDPRVLDSIGRLRAEVWRSERSVEFGEFGDSDCWLDEYDQHSIHWAVFHAGELVAAARLSLHDRLEDVPYAHVFKSIGYTVAPGPGRIASINRLVVKKCCQGRGISKILDDLRLEKARELGAAEVLAIPVGEIRTRVLMRIGYRELASSIDPAKFGVQIKNTKLAVLSAPLDPMIELQADPSFKPAASELR